MKTKRCLKDSKKWLKKQIKLVLRKLKLEKYVDVEPR